MPAFRERLLATLRAAEPVFGVPGVLVVGSEVPNLLEPGAAATLVVSQDVDLAIPIDSHQAVKDRLAQLDEVMHTTTLIPGLAPELRHAVRSNLTILSLLGPRPFMPDPRLVRDVIARLLDHLEER